VGIPVEGLVLTCFLDRAVLVLTLSEISVATIVIAKRKGNEIKDYGGNLTGSSVISICIIKKMCMREKLTESKVFYPRSYYGNLSKTTI
jgi:hypothetical protein